LKEFVFQAEAWFHQRTAEAFQYVSVAQCPANTKGLFAHIHRAKALKRAILIVDKLSLRRVAVKDK
jgi:hypothetical protein